MITVDHTILQKKVVRTPVLPDVDFLDRGKITKKLDNLTKYNLNEVCWSELNHIPDTKFTIAYNADAIVVKYYVSEGYHQATFTQPNDPVFKDSCVEFFIAIDDSGNYYNFEFNSLGTCLASYGKDRNGRTKLDKGIINEIVCWVDWKEDPHTEMRFKWELTVVLTPAVFIYNQITHFTSGRYKANFYKCGDDLAEPHYLAWNKIANPVRDFHQLDYFGLLLFD